MSLRGQIIRFEPLRSIAFGDISGVYAAIGSPSLNAIRSIMFFNTTNANMVISFDGVNDHLLAVADSGQVYDYASNRVDPVGQLEQPIGTQVWVKQESGAPTAGTFYVAMYYGAIR